MNSTKYIIAKIDELIKQFPAVKLSYQVDEWSETHFIEVLPKEYFECYDDKFVAVQNKIILDFIKLYPEEGLAFITKDDLFLVDNPIYVKTGSNYECEDQSSLIWYSDRIEQLLLDFEAQIDTSPMLTQKMEEFYQNAVRCSFKFTEKKRAPSFEPLTNNLSKKSTRADYEIEGIDEADYTNSYYLAA